MSYKSKSLRAFVGAKNYAESIRFYEELGFSRVGIDDDMCLFVVSDNLSFYLQRYYNKEWVDNTMLFLEVDSVDDCYEEIKALDLSSKYELVKMTKIIHQDWGSEFHLMDPSGVLWHFGRFPESA